jgi:hypothetical protein
MLPLATEKSIIFEGKKNLGERYTQVANQVGYFTQAGDIISKR